MQGEKSLLKEEVDAEDIAEVVAKWTGVPVSKMLQSDREKLLQLEAELGKRIAGQKEAITAVSDAVRRSRRRRRWLRWGVAIHTDVPVLGARNEGLEECEQQLRAAYAMVS